MANYNLTELQSLTRQAGWPENLIAKAAAIWMYESGGNPNAHNPNGENSHGLAQINLPFHPTMTVAKARDPLTALQYAYKLLKARPDWGDWYNSNKKYERDFQGIASQSRAIYSGSNITPTGGSSSVIATALPQAAAAGIFGKETVIIILVGLGALALINSRSDY